MTPRQPRRPALLLVAALLVAGVAPAAADAPRSGAGKKDPALDQARRHFERGQKLFSRLLFAEALEEYETAYEAKAIPDFLFNIGQCHRNLGHYREAIFSFRRYLALVPDAEDRERVEELVAELEAEERKANGRKTTPPPPPPGGGSKPVYTRWWFWTGIAVIAGGTAAVVITTSGSGLPSTDLGNLDFPQ